MSDQLNDDETGSRPFEADPETARHTPRIRWFADDVLAVDDPDPHDICPACHGTGRR